MVDDKYIVSESEVYHMVYQIMHQFDDTAASPSNIDKWATKAAREFVSELEEAPEEPIHEEWR